MVLNYDFWKLFQIFTSKCWLLIKKCNAAILMFPFNLFLTSFETRDSVVFNYRWWKEASHQSIVMNLQTPKHLSLPFVFLKKRQIPPVKQKRKNVFRSDYALNGKSCCVNFLITRILKSCIRQCEFGSFKANLWFSNKWSAKSFLGLIYNHTEKWK